MTKDEIFAELKTAMLRHAEAAVEVDFLRLRLKYGGDELPSPELPNRGKRKGRALTNEELTEQLNGNEVWEAQVDEYIAANEKQLEQAEIMFLSMRVKTSDEVRLICGSISEGAIRKRHKQLGYAYELLPVKGPSGQKCYDSLSIIKANLAKRLEREAKRKR